MRARITRRSALAAAAALGGCSGLRSSDDEEGDPEPDDPLAGGATQQGDLELTSPAFDDDGPIPAEYAREGRNVNPPLRIDGAPDDAESLLLLVDDPDAVEPAGEVWVHWLVWNVDPSREEVPVDWEADDAVEGENDFGEVGYDGPDPPNDEHTYRFKLYALDASLDVSSGSTREDVGEAVDEDDVLARTQLAGTYAPE